MDKVYGTIISLGGRQYDKMKELGYTGFHNQFRIICKATSYYKANKKCEEAGLWHNAFKPNFSSPTGNARELELAQISDIWICVDGSMTHKDSKWVTPEELNT